MTEQVGQLQSGDVGALRLDFDLTRCQCVLKKRSPLHPCSLVEHPLVGILQQSVLYATATFCHHISASIDVIKITAVPLKHESHGQVVRVRCCIAVPGQHSLLVDNHSHDAKIGFPDNF